MIYHLQIKFRWEEDKVQLLVREAESIFDRNTVGPKRYISLYQKYTGLLSGEADKDKDRFLAGKPPLKGNIIYCKSNIMLGL